MNSPQYTLRQLTVYFLKLGTIGFGGPVALVGYMHRDLVEQRKWITEEDYKEGLALAQLAPGPLAAQLSIYLGYVHYRIIGATLAGLAFVCGEFQEDDKHRSSGGIGVARRVHFIRTCMRVCLAFPSRLARGAS